MPLQMEWVYLFIAGLFETGWAISLKYSEGLSRLWPTVGVVAFMILSLYFLGQALKDLSVGTAYAVWTGIGVIGTTVLGIALLDESRDTLRLVCILLIVAGVVGLKLASE